MKKENDTRAIHDEYIISKHCNEESDVYTHENERANNSEEGVP